MFERYIHLLTRWPWLIAAVVLSLALGAASGMRLLTFDASYEVFFSERNPQLTAFHAFERVYTRSDNILFVLAPQDGDVFTRETLAAVEWLTQQGWQTPWSRRVDSITNFQHTEAEEDDLYVRDLVEQADSLDAAALRRVRAIALDEPLLLNRLVSPDGSVTAVNITEQIEPYLTSEPVEWIPFQYGETPRSLLIGEAYARLGDDAGAGQQFEIARSLLEAELSARPEDRFPTCSE